MKPTSELKNAGFRENLLQKKCQDSYVLESQFGRTAGLCQRNQDFADCAILLEFAAEDAENAVDLVARRRNRLPDRSIPKIAVVENAVEPIAEKTIRASDSHHLAGCGARDGSRHRVRLGCISADGAK